MAGRNAVSEVNKHVEREKELNDLKARLEDKEMELNGKLAMADRATAAFPALAKVC